MRCPGCGVLAPWGSFPPSVDSNEDQPADDPWWCTPCLGRKVRTARRAAALLAELALQLPGVKEHLRSVSRNVKRRRFGGLAEGVPLCQLFPPLITEGA